MNLLKTTLAALILTVPLTTFARPASPQAQTPRFDNRQAVQERRIDQGVRSGDLTRQEAAHLYRGQQRLQALEYRAKADGRVMPRERARLQQAQDVQSRRIYREKHDHQRAYHSWRQTTYRYYVRF